MEASKLQNDLKCEIKNEAAENMELPTVNGSDTDNENEKTFKAASTSRSYKKNYSEVHKLYGYNKKQLLEHMQAHGCSAQEFDKAVKSFKIKKETALEFLNERMQQAEEHVHEECDSISFQNINAWLGLLKKTNLPEHCLYEPALMMNVIAENEQLPDAKELNGVDLKSIYEFLRNALLGLPQPQLSAESMQFLAKEFESLVEEGNTENGDIDTTQMYNQLDNWKQPESRSKNKLSLDPLGLNEDLVLK